jgi:hypothetical protein
MLAFPGLDVREKAVGSCVERGQRRLVIPTQAVIQRCNVNGTRIPSSTISTISFDAHVISIHLLVHSHLKFPTRHLSIQIKVVLI